jgi:cytochrome c oxidase cbb3-type subunit IV
MYALLATLAQTTGTFFFIAAFLMITAYALWPKNGATFDRASRAALNEDDTP